METSLSTELIEKIAKNINAMDTYYHYISGDLKKWEFWYKLDNTIRKVLKQLSELDKTAVKALCNKTEAEYFGLI